MWLRMAAFSALIALVMAAPGCGGSSSSSPSQSQPLQPNISISPATAAAGSPDLTLTIMGANFDGAGFVRSRAVWIANGSTTPLATTFVSDTKLTAVVPEVLLASPVEAQVTVQLYDSMGGDINSSSSLVGFVVTLSIPSNSSVFVPTASMGVARSGHTATLLMNGKVLIAGGDAIGVASAELFDPVNATFAPTGNMNAWRYGATATLLPNGMVLIAGGFGTSADELPRLNTAELYDPVAGTFSATGSMAVGRFMHTATLLGDGRVLIAGGTRKGGGGGAAVGSAELYDPTVGTFTVTGGMISDRAQHTATLLETGEVLVAGGWNGHAADAPDDPPWDPLFAELFNPSSGSFTSTGSMSTTRIGHVAIRLTTGKVLTLGGILNPQNLHQPIDPKYAELFDPAAHTFSSLGSITMSRAGYSATLLTDGKVLLSGGEDQGRIVGTVELLDPISGSLSATGGLATGREGHTATLLNDGRVLVAGGVDSNGNALAAAELFK